MYLTTFSSVNINFLFLQFISLFHNVETSDRYDRVVRILGTEVVEDVVQQDIKEQKELEEQRRMEQMLKGSVLKQLEWATQKRQMENQQHKENKTKYRGLEI